MEDKFKAFKKIFIMDFSFCNFNKPANRLNGIN